MAAPPKFDLTLDSAFSYTCRACTRCCYTHRVRVTPFDVLALARHLGISTTQVLRQYLDGDGALLRNSETGGCVFLGRGGCTAHAGRPLACRLYPLGRRIESQGGERFHRLEAHPATEGIYGERGTVRDFLREQGAMDHLQASDRYLQLFCKAVATLGSLPDVPSASPEANDAFLDADAMIARHRPDIEVDSLDPLSAMAVHVEVIEALLQESNLPAQESSHV